ncbi:VOC family protein [Kribbella jejuensis]|uniref:Catechol 2,3-dioxygenase-like lactoylglutathione lyase family enzyme n=1 Tax=Kribbella jejuensis TaxID=236068 RepID=A0A542DU69_9ACTN|nr:VOC family protein [Kribbella jejuensis]TQJ06651.1 catechol 2,3-dioxygenase-like lactoylglutathione lyase family enzyme [Kribbella jejuensis]
MAIKRLDHIGVVVEDLAAAKAFFLELGMELVGETTVSGPWVEGVSGLPGVVADISFLRTPDGHGQLELTTYRKPLATTAEPSAPPNTLGIRNLMFAVDDVRDTAERLKAHGGELVGTIEEYTPSKYFCYLRGPQGIIIALAED